MLFFYETWATTFFSFFCVEGVIIDIIYLNNNFRHILLSYEPVSFSLKLSITYLWMEPNIPTSFLVCLIWPQRKQK